MSKPRNISTKTIRRPKLVAGALSIIALESKGKITGFKVRYREEEKEFPVKGNKIDIAFKEAEKHATKLLLNDKV